MKISPFIIALLLLTTGSNGQQFEKLKNLNSKQFRELQRNDTCIIIDVRTLSEYKSQHIEDAGQLNFYALDFRKKLLLLPKRKNVLLYCNTGFRSRIAANILMKNGYEKVYNLENGIMEWNLHDFPTVADNDIVQDKKNNLEISEFKKTLISSATTFNKHNLKVKNIS